MKSLAVLLLFPAFVGMVGCGSKSSTPPGPTPPPATGHWSALGSGVNGTVDALAVYHDALIAGGSFTTAGGNSAMSIARWDGTSWSALGLGLEREGSGLKASVSALANYNGYLIAGGIFTLAGGESANCVAQWDGSTWSPLGEGVQGSWQAGLDPEVTALAVYDGVLYAGGNFIQAGQVQTSCIARWDGEQWRAAGAALNPQDYMLYVADLTTFQDGLVAGGRFSLTALDGSLCRHVARWDGTSWTGLGSGIGRFNGVSALTVFQDGLIAGGNFLEAGAAPAKSVARWAGGNWSGLGAGVGASDPNDTPTVYALTPMGESLIAGGLFSLAGDSLASKIARWDGARWTRLGSGIGGLIDPLYVGALSVYRGDLVAGGSFTTAGGSEASGIARWTDE
jgi:hypothetical protein